MTPVTMVASGGTGPYTYSISAGALPLGIGINSSTGVISGTSQQIGVFSFTVRATDTNRASGDQPLTMTVTNFGTSILTLPILPPH